MEQKLSAFQKYIKWSNERFPLAGVILYSGSLFYVSYFFGRIFNGSSSPSILESSPGFAVIFLVLLHIRIFDEHKDYDKDLLAYPERVLSKGLITLKDLRILLYITVGLEIGFSLYLGMTQSVLWLIIMAWSLLMFVEFFVPEFLNRRMGLYLLTHQLIVPLVLIYGFSICYDLSAVNSGDSLSILLFLSGSMCATITYEIARKTWSSDRENENADSYTKVWGIGKSIIVNQLNAIISGVCFVLIYFSFNISIVYSVIVALLNLIFLVTGILFFKDPVNKKSKLVEAGGTLFVLGIFVNSIVAFVLFG